MGVGSGKGEREEGRGKREIGEKGEGEGWGWGWGLGRPLSRKICPVPYIPQPEKDKGRECCHISGEDDE